jgi:hypothetical protein
MFLVQVPRWVIWIPWVVVALLFGVVVANFGWTWGITLVLFWMLRRAMFTLVVGLWMARRA